MLILLLAAISTGSAQWSGESAGILGEWAYQPVKKEKVQAGLYPPEFIRLTLSKDGEGVRGTLRARFKAPKPVSPDVNFDLKSEVAPWGEFAWTEENGLEGTLQIVSVVDKTMRIEWKAKRGVPHGAAQLTSGQATLIRQ